MCNSPNLTTQYSHLREALTRSKLTKMNALGTHVFGEFIGCEYMPNDPEVLRQIMEDACKEMNATIVDSVFHTFNPFGLSGVVVIAESHVAIHTWPEYKCIAIDIFTCSMNTDSLHGIDCLKKVFKPHSIDWVQVNRGEKIIE